MTALCRAGGKHNPQKSYGKPHVPFPAMFNGEPAYSCLYCGAWVTATEGGKS